MVHVKRAVGYVQITLGIMLIFASFVASDMLLSQLNKQYSQVSASYENVARENNLTLTTKELLDDYQFLTISKINTSFTIQAMVVLIFILAVTMVLQGVANTRTGSDDIPPSELSKFIITIFFILYIIAVIYVLFFKTLPSGRVSACINFLVLLLAFLLVLFLISRVIKKAEKKKGAAKK